MRGEQQQFGLVVFFLVPSVAGFLVAIFTAEGTRAFGCALCTILLTLSILIFTGWEGYICCIMALPLLLAGVGVGTIIGIAIKRHADERGRGNSSGSKMLFLVGATVLLLGAKKLEQPYISVPRNETFEQRIKIPVNPAKAWDLIKAMDHLNGPKPFLLKIGLPIPESCELDKEAVGGQRVCHFNSGIIAQEIIDWNPPVAMRFKINRSTLPGRHWLKFVEAGYDFIPDSEGTIVVRKTTISSGLYPRWYWRMFEEWGVQSEHSYVLADLKRRADNQKP